MAKVTTIEAAGESGGSTKRASAERAPVLVVGGGRGAAGKSTVLAMLAYRARNNGREVMVADFDPQSRTLRNLFPGAVKPKSDELPDVKDEFVELLNTVAKGDSAVVDFGGGDTFMKEMGKDLPWVRYCAKRGIEPLALFVLSPDQENLNHVLSLFDSGHFNPKRMVLLLNEGVIREGKTTRGAFDDIMSSDGYQRMVNAGAVPLLLPRLPCMGVLTKSALTDPSAMDFYAAAAGDGVLDFVQQFMVETWLEDFETKVQSLGIADWLP